MRAKKLFFKETHLAGRQYHDADEVWEELKVGTLLRLERDPYNRYDNNAVQVVYERDSADEERFLLGYLPRSENDAVAALLEMGWDKIFECRISKIIPDEYYENQVRLTIRILRNDKNENEDKDIC